MGRKFRLNDMYKSFERYLRYTGKSKSLQMKKTYVEALRLGLTSFPKLKRIAVTPEASQSSYFLPHYETPFFFGVFHLVLS